MSTDKECAWCETETDELSYPHIFDMGSGKMCRACWDHDREVYKGSMGTDIGEFTPVVEEIPEPEWTDLGTKSALFLLMEFRRLAILEHEGAKDATVSYDVDMVEDEIQMRLNEYQVDRHDIEGNDD